MMSKAELSRKANVSPITISRIEKGMQCRMETKRKIILALGFKLSEKNKIFNDFVQNINRKNIKQRFAEDILRKQNYKAIKILQCWKRYSMGFHAAIEVLGGGNR